MPKPEDYVPFKAVVSPCSSCHNHNTDPTNGKPICPRRLLAEQDKKTGEIPGYLLESGTDSPDQLANPVFSEEQQTVLIWVAALLDNRIFYNANGTVATGSISNQEEFDTTYTRCRVYPFLPAAPWSELLHNGTYQEWDDLLVYPAPDTQEEQMASDNAAPARLMTGGFARKTSFVYGFDQTTPQIDRIPSGA